MSSVSDAYSNFQIEGLEGTRGVMVLGVDSVTDVVVVVVVVGSDSSGPMGKVLYPKSGMVPATKHTMI